MSEEYNVILGPQEITLYIADVQMNNTLKCLDLKPDYKWFADTVLKEIPIVTDKAIAIIRKAMAESRANKDFYVPAVQVGDELLMDVGVKEVVNISRLFPLIKIGCASLLGGEK